MKDVLYNVLQAIGVEAVRRFITNVSSTDITYHEYEGAHHVLLFCPERKHVLDQMVSWLLTRAERLACCESLASPRAHMVHHNGTTRMIKGRKWGLSSEELMHRPSRSTSNAAAEFVNL